MRPLGVTKPNHMFINEFETKVNQAKSLDFGIIFSESIELFKKVWLQGLVTLLLTVVIIIPFYLIIYIPLIALSINPEMIHANDSVNPLFIIGMVLFFMCFGTVASAVSIGMRSAFYRICKLKDSGALVSDDYFYYFKKPYFMKLIVLSVVIMLISILATLLFVLPLFYAIIPLSFINVVFAFNPDQSVSDIIKASFKLGTKKWLIAFGLMVVCGFLAEIIGVMMCFIGVFVTVSFAYIPLYIIYKEVIGFENSEDETVSIETLA